MSPPRETWIARLIAAERAEAEARDTVRRHRSHIAKLIAEAVANGVSHDRIASGILRHRLGRAPSTEERQREAERLRKCRRRGTGCPAEVVAASLSRHSSAVESSDEVNAMNRRIRKTTTVEEVFDDDDGKPEAECADEMEAAAGDDDDDESEEEEEDGEEDE